MSSQTATASSRVETTNFGYGHVIDAICNLNWIKLTEEDIIRVAWAYNSVSASKSHARCIPMMSDCCSSIMASATPTIFRPGRE
jgi:hypothetical protein